jgi:hypothetical protein
VSPSAAPPSQPGNALPAEVTVVSVADPAAVLATVSLATGWNLFSLPVANLTAQDVAPAGGVAALFSWSAGAWTSVTADTPLTAGAGYWLYLTAAPCSITVAGAVPQSPEVANPNPEWNLVGPITVQAVDDLGSAWGTPGPVWTWDNVAKAYQPETWRLYPGRGYWIWCPPR